jgi:hypothetical protein
VDQQTDGISSAGLSPLAGVFLAQKRIASALVVKLEAGMNVQVDTIQPYNFARLGLFLHVSDAFTTRISHALFRDLDEDRSNARCLARPQWDVMSATISVQYLLTSC